MQELYQVNPSGANSALFSWDASAIAGETRISGAGIGAAFTSGDVSFFFRSIVGLTRFGASPAVSLMGSGNIFNAALGANGICDGMRAYRVAKACGDTKGRSLSAQKAFANVAQLIGGLALGPARFIVSGAQLAHTTISSHSTALGQAAFYSSTIGVVAFSAFYTLLALPFTATAVHEGQFLRKIQKAVDTHEAGAALKYLHERLHSDSKKTRLKIGKDSQKAKKLMIKQGVSSLQSTLKQMQREGKWDNRDKLPTNVELTEIVEAAYTQMTAVDRAKIQEDYMTARHEAKKRVKMERLIGGVLTNKLLNEAPALLERIERGDDKAEAEAEQLVGSVIDRARFKHRMNWFIVFMCFVGTAVFAASLIFTGGIGATLVMATMVLVSMVFFGIDAKMLQDDLREGAHGRADPTFIKVSNVLTVASMAVAFTVTLVFHLAFPPLIMVSLIGLGMLAVNTYALRRVRENQQKDPVRVKPLNQVHVHMLHPKRKTD